MNKLFSLADDELVGLYIDGDNRAFDVLIDKYKDKLFSYVFHIVKDAELANDIFQETFIKAITTINSGRYAANGKFAAWITRIAHNLIIDYYRQEKSENVQSCDCADYDLLNDRELCDETVEDWMVRNQIHSDVRRLVRALPKSQQDVLLLRYYKDMSFKEIADLTNVSINTALGRMRYAILNLRKMVEDNGIVLTM